MWLWQIFGFIFSSYSVHSDERVGYSGHGNERYEISGGYGFERSDISGDDRRRGFRYHEITHSYFCNFGEIVDVDGKGG